MKKAIVIDGSIQEVDVIHTIGRLSWVRGDSIGFSGEEDIVVDSSEIFNSPDNSFYELRAAVEELSLSDKSVLRLWGKGVRVINVEK